MATRWGPGPVFWYEVLTGSRRKRLYAVRSAVVLLLLCVLAWLWSVISDDLRDASTLARVGSAFYKILFGFQMIVVLLVAPAATAGAICVDKARGSLTHALVTDLNGTPDGRATGPLALDWYLSDAVRLPHDGHCANVRPLPRPGPPAAKLEDNA